MRDASAVSAQAPAATQRFKLHRSTSPPKREGVAVTNVRSAHGVTSVLYGSAIPHHARRFIWVTRRGATGSYKRELIREASAIWRHRSHLLRLRTRRRYARTPSPCPSSSRSPCSAAWYALEIGRTMSEPDAISAVLLFTRALPARLRSSALHLRRHSPARRRTVRGLSVAAFAGMCGGAEAAFSARHATAAPRDRASPAWTGPVDAWAWHRAWQPQGVRGADLRGGRRRARLLVFGRARELGADLTSRCAAPAIRGSCRRRASTMRAGSRALRLRPPRVPWFGVPLLGRRRCRPRRHPWLRRYSATDAIQGRALGGGRRRRPTAGAPCRSRDEFLRGAHVLGDFGERAAASGRRRSVAIAMPRRALRRELPLLRRSSPCSSRALAAPSPTTSPSPSVASTPPSPAPSTSRSTTAGEATTLGAGDHGVSPPVGSSPRAILRRRTRRLAEEELLERARGLARAPCGHVRRPGRNALPHLRWRSRGATTTPACWGSASATTTARSSSRSSSSASPARSNQCVHARRAGRSSSRCPPASPPPKRRPEEVETRQGRLRPALGSYAYVSPLAGCALFLWQQTTFLLHQRGVLSWHLS